MIVGPICVCGINSFIWVCGIVGGIGVYVINGLIWGLAVNGRGDFGGLSCAMDLILDRRPLGPLRVCL